jgi:tRNA pseudouridine38-40 synthase
MGHSSDLSAEGGDNSNHTVPGVLETLDAALEAFIGRECYTNLRGSSRTDAGVSAICNRFHVDIARPVKVRRSKDGESFNLGLSDNNTPGISNVAINQRKVVEYSSDPPFDPQIVVKAMNKYLQLEQVHIKDARVVDSTFDAVRNALSRTYMYRIVHTPGLRGDSNGWLFQTDQAWNACGKLDIMAMRQAAAFLVGTHDFTSFRNSGCVAKTPVRNLISLEIAEYDSKDVVRCGDPSSIPTSTKFSDPFLLGPSRLIIVHVRANAFLYRMVRNMVSVLVKVGRGQMSTADVKTLLQSKDRAKAPPPAPANGLFLTHVEYAEESEWNKNRWE